MMCVICNQATTLPGRASVLLERDHISLTITNIPAQVCPCCGEAFADETVTTNLLRLAEMHAKAGIKVEAFEYTPAGEGVGSNRPG